MKWRSYIQNANGNRFTFSSWFIFLRKLRGGSENSKWMWEYVCIDVASDWSGLRFLKTFVADCNSITGIECENRRRLTCCCYHSKCFSFFWCLQNFKFLFHRNLVFLLAQFSKRCIHNLTSYPVALQFIVQSLQKRNKFQERFYWSIYSHSAT